MRRLFGTDGVRGVVGEMLTVELATKIGRTLATVLSGKGRKLGGNKIHAALQIEASNILNVTTTHVIGLDQEVE